MQRRWLCRVNFILTRKEGKGAFKLLLGNAVQLDVYYISYLCNRPNTKFLLARFSTYKEQPN